MVGRQMQVEFERLIQLINPEYVIEKKIDSDTIFYFLNVAQERFIKQNYLSIDNTRDSYEHLKKNTDSFKSLITTVTTSTAGTVITNQSANSYALPTNFFLYLRSSCLVTGTYMAITTPALVPNKFVTQEEVENISVSYFNSPILRQPCALLTDETLDIYHDSLTTLTACSITYIRNPLKITHTTAVTDVSTLTCELSSNVHQEIVELAVDIFISEAVYRLSSNPRQKQKDN
jgi:hypothetical protein